MRVFSVNLNSFDGLKNRFNTKISRDSIDLRNERAKKIVEYIMDEKQKIDIAIFQEFDYTNAMYEWLISFLKKHGWQCVREDNLAWSYIFCNLIVVKNDSNMAVEGIKNIFSKILLNRWQEVEIVDKNTDKKFYLLDFHRKGAVDVYALLKYFKKRKNEYSIIMGDFNAARRSQRAITKKTDESIIYENEEFLNLFDCAGYKEIGDDTDTFYPHNDKSDGRRIDHCFVSSNMAEYCHGYTDENLNTQTDHAAIVLDIDFV